MKKKPAGVCRIEAPCKINPHLTIGEKRPDGFHSLESIFAALDFGDTLRFECFDEEGGCDLDIHWECTGEFIPPEENLVYRAVSLFRAQTGFKNALRIRLDKRVPAGAGLGGGSSDAASALLALNALAGTELTAEKLAKMAAALGSDLPFFLSGGTAFVSGRGEIIEPVNTPAGLWVVLCKPPFSSDTRSAFWLVDEFRAREKEALKGEKLSKSELILNLLEKPESWRFRNDFLPIFLASGSFQNGETKDKAGIYQRILKGLQKNGALFAGLSGSGSCCFGIFRSKGLAEVAEREFSGEFFTRITNFLAKMAKPVLE